MNFMENSKKIKIRTRSSHFADGIDILLETDELLALDKPAGLLAVRDRWDKAQETLVDFVRSYLGKNAWAVHRLDKEASGVILFAKNSATRTSLEQQFQKREVHKNYHVFIQGEIDQDKGTIDLNLSEDPERPGRTKVDRKKGKPSLTHFVVLERFKGVTYLKVTPMTGRQHQIRVHLQALGHPVICDALYGSGRPYYLSEMKRFYKVKKDEPEKPLMSRLALHAERLTFLTLEDTVQTVESPLPKDFVVFLKYLRKFWGRGF
jgi:23S rRNA pseudouridine955/2504/2580 synthase/23S rRNA pseudouridine1911/1915/1917 synthase